MENEIPRGSWLESDAFRELVRQVVPLRMGGWSLTEFEGATSALGWELQGPVEVADQVWRRFDARKGPWGGYATVIADAAEPDQVRGLNVRVVDIPAEDVPTAAARVRTAWWVMEEELGPPTLWGGDVGPWMLWRRPGTSLLLHTHDGGEVSLELLHTDADDDAAGRVGSRGSWRAADPADLSPATATAAPTRPGADWDEVRTRLAEALRSLSHDTPFFPGMFIVHLGSARDPERFVQCWSDGPDLVVEATGYMHLPEPADPARLARSGWESAHSLDQRRFPDAMNESAHADTAARMLVEVLRNLDVDPADLAYEGTMTGRGHHFHLDLPKSGLPRGLPD